MKNLPQYTMLALITCGVVTVTHTQYFSRNTAVMPNSRDRYQFNLPDSPNNTYRSAPVPYSINPVLADQDAIRQHGQPEVPQYSKERDINKSALMQQDRMVAQQQAQPIAQQDPTAPTQQATIPAGYSEPIQSTKTPAQQGIPERDQDISVR